MTSKEKLENVSSEGTTIDNELAETVFYSCEFQSYYFIHMQKISWLTH